MVNVIVKKNIKKTYGRQYNTKTSNSVKNKKRNSYTYNDNKIKKTKYKKKKYRKKTSKAKILFFIIFLSVILLIVFSVFRNIDNEYKESNQINQKNMTKEEFIKNIEEISISEYRRSGILPSITISQAIIESNWGQSKLTQKANNLFGIKYSNNWRGGYVIFSTGENYNDVINAKFRKYNSWEESIEDHTNFLLNNKRYKNAGIFKSKDYKVQAQALEDGGYATTKNVKGEKIYAEKLIDAIEKYKLYEIDKKVVGRSFFDR
ncbi:glycoside hydrolase family 73 protein [Peptostreptococcus equinus]|uniref:Glucosaminidase domain-containing protein n=1 Tax=Peptostreptococcus equinus TaxID=3003601 RepID=A0ABY7JR31_9FIRM|nr:glucosaminidase domain-containing protein [Peptostreptococcus sp. CBA3647]WAW15575.1 glucosaminidase domain-containing protein [Peptostreptococcus sp. CBA3647]